MFRLSCTRAQCSRPSWSVVPPASSSISSPSGVESFGDGLWWGCSAPLWPTRTHWTTWRRENLSMMKWVEQESRGRADEVALTTDSRCRSWRHILANCPVSSEWRGQTARLSLCLLPQGVATFPVKQKEGHFCPLQVYRGKLSVISIITIQTNLMS